jgi:hypothetical protein
MTHLLLQGGYQLLLVFDQSQTLLHLEQTHTLCYTHSAAGWLDADVHVMFEPGRTGNVRPEKEGSACAANCAFCSVWSSP